MTSPTIPPSLAKYEPEILAMLAAVGRRRAELRFMYGSYAPVHIPRAAPRITDAQLSIKFWPLVGMAAARSGTGGAWRAWTLAKHLDASGRGAVPLAALQALADRLHVHPKTWRRWMAEARRRGLITDTQRSSGEHWLVLISQGQGAVALGCSDAGPRPASISAYDLVAPGWRAHVWAAYEQTHGGRLVSRAKQEILSGVPISTQRAYDNQACVDRRPNYAVSRRPADELTGVIEFERRAAPFVFTNPKRRRSRRTVQIRDALPSPGGAWQQRHQVVAWRLPDSRTARFAQSEPRGRSRRVNGAIMGAITRHPDVSLLPERDLSHGVGRFPIWRLFFETAKQARSYDRKLSTAVERPDELYILKPDGRNAGLWDVLPLGG